MRSAHRVKVYFLSGGTLCAAWHYPGTNRACVVMAGGFAVTKEPGTDRFAAPFHQAGFSVLAFDYRGIGESDGRPRQVQRIKDQLADWNAALQFAATLPGVDPARVSAWGFSLSGGHIFRVAAENPQLAAAIAQTPNADGRAASWNAMRYQKPAAMMRMVFRGVLDTVGGLLGLRPLLVPLDGPPGTVALLTTPDAIGGGEVLNPDGRYPDWLQAVAARSVLPVGRYRPGQAAAKVQCPLLVVVCDDDRSALAEPSIIAARSARRGEVVRFPGGHYAPFLDQYPVVLAAELAFLRRELLDTAEHT